MNEEQRTLIAIAELNPDTPTIDLHGMRLHEAEIEVDRFLDKMFRQGERVARIVHGKGTERLAQAIPEFLKQHPLVEAVGTAMGMHEMGAVVYVIVKL